MRRSTRATVRGVPQDRFGNGKLYVEYENRILPIDISSCPNAAKDLHVDCVISISTICILDAESWRPSAPFPKIKGFMLVLRSPSDITILRQPPWWTPRRLATAIATLIKNYELAALTLDSCREDLRNCLWDLHNQTLEDTDINEAIRKTLTPHTTPAKLFIRFNVPRERLTDNTTHAILRILRELAINATRHGHATEIRIAGCIEDGRLLFSVRDNGCGFDPATAKGMEDGHFGLQGIRDRIDGFEGDVSIDSAPGRGTKVTITIKTEHP